MPKVKRKPRSPQSPQFPLNSKTILALFLALALGFLGGFGYSKYFPSQKAQVYPEKASVSRIIDGDTIELGSGRAVRLYGISCPDRDEPYYSEAKEFTKDQVAGKKISLEYQPNYQSDKFGRLLGYVIINDQILRHGMTEWCQKV